MGVRNINRLDFTPLAIQMTEGPVEQQVESIRQLYLLVNQLSANINILRLQLQDLKSSLEATWSFTPSDYAIDNHLLRHWQASGSSISTLNANLWLYAEVCRIFQHYEESSAVISPPDYLQATQES